MIRPEQIAPKVYKLGVFFVNVYFVSDAEDADTANWVLVDAGIPGVASRIAAAAQHVFGPRPPQAIVLTHGHVDHAGSAFDLAEMWRVPILAAPREMPFLGGRSDYPPKDPTVGGYMGAFSRMLSSKGFFLRPYLEKLDELPSAMSDWRVIPTPGHTPGHLAFFRDADKTLLAGDAIATTDLQSWTKAPLWIKEISRPPLPFTPDWEAARESVEILAELEPATVGAGHGQAMSGEVVAQQLRALAAAFPIPPPEGGRYACEAPQYDEAGILRRLPPALPDRRAQGVMLTSLGLLAYSLWRMMSNEQLRTTLESLLSRY